MADPKDKAEAGDERARARDPHGKTGGGEPGEDQPKGTPTDDRHDTERASS